jgi:crotonobetainyl-CoA:carnitine CoA-transferase CaiB-like acyl-CoA transferase
VISVFNDDEWKALCQVMGREDLASDPRFKTIPARKQNEEALDSEIEKWTSKLSAEEVFKKLQDRGVKAGFVEHMDDMFKDPQLKHRGFWAPVDHPEIGRYHAEGPPFLFSKTPFKIDRPAPMLGQHNELVFQKFVGVPKDEYDRLVKEGVIA